jgi:hypothetical protein
MHLSAAKKRREFKSKMYCPYIYAQLHVGGFVTKEIILFSHCKVQVMKLAFSNPSAVLQLDHYETVSPFTSTSRCAFATYITDFARAGKSYL